MKIGVKQYATLFTAAMGSLFAGSSVMHAILKPDLVRLSFAPDSHTRTRYLLTET